MSTSAVVTVIGVDQRYHVHIPYGGCPDEIARLFQATFAPATAPNFEPGAWAAAIVAAAMPIKERRGAAATPGRSVRLAANWLAYDDLAFRYEITTESNALRIAAFGRGPGQELEPIYEGSLDGFLALAGTAPEPSRPNRFRIALDIVDPGACNPSGIAHAVIEACRQAREAGIGTQRDVAVRLIVTQLAWICRRRLRPLARGVRRPSRFALSGRSQVTCPVDQPKERNHAGDQRRSLFPRSRGLCRADRRT